MNKTIHFRIVLVFMNSHMEVLESNSLTLTKSRVFTLNKKIPSLEKFTDF